MAEIIRLLESLFGVSYGRLSRTSNKAHFMRWDVEVKFPDSPKPIRIQSEEFAKLLDQRPISEISRILGVYNAEGLTGEFITRSSDFMISVEVGYLIKKNKKGDLRLVPEVSKI